MNKVYLFIIGLALLFPIVYVIYSFPCEEKVNNSPEKVVNTVVRPAPTQLPPPPPPPPLPKMPPINAAK